MFYGGFVGYKRSRDPFDTDKGKDQETFSKRLIKATKKMNSLLSSFHNSLSVHTELKMIIKNSPQILVWCDNFHSFMMYDASSFGCSWCKVSPKKFWSHQETKSVRACPMSWKWLPFPHAVFVTCLLTPSSSHRCPVCHPPLQTSPVGVHQEEKHERSLPPPRDRPEHHRQHGVDRRAPPGRQRHGPFGGHVSPRRRDSGQLRT